MRVVGSGASRNRAAAPASSHARPRAPQPTLSSCLLWPRTTCFHVKYTEFVCLPLGTCRYCSVSTGDEAEAWGGERLTSPHIWEVTGLRCLLSLSPTLRPWGFLHFPHPQAQLRSRLRAPSADTPPTPVRSPGSYPASALPALF